MSFIDQPAARACSISYINDNYLADEQELVRQLAMEADPGEATRKRILETAAQLVLAVRKNTENEGGIEAFLKQYDLSSDEGVLLMCIAEALLRIRAHAFAAGQAVGAVATEIVAHRLRLADDRPDLEGRI